MIYYKILYSQTGQFCLKISEGKIWLNQGLSFISSLTTSSKLEVSISGWACFVWFAVSLANIKMAFSICHDLWWILFKAKAFSICLFLIERKYAKIVVPAVAATIKRNSSKKLPIYWSSTRSYNSYSWIKNILSFYW